MAQFYSLEEAANRLAIGTDEFKRRLKTEWTSIRPFRDGATLRFRAADIDELARSLGAASDPGLPLGPVGSTPADSSLDEPLDIGGTGEAEVFSLTGGDAPTGSSGRRPRGGDSDVRLDTGRTPPGSDPEAALPTEEIALDLSGPSSGSLKAKGGSSGKLSAPKSGVDLSGPDSGSKIPSATSKSPLSGPDSSSEFELSLDSDSDSFELQLSGDSSEEVDLGGLDQPASKGGQSGINLGKPSDSGVSLEKKGPKSSKITPGKKPADDDSDVDFELSLDPTGSSAARLAGPRSGSGARKPPPRAEDSSSEFELTLDDNSGVVEGLSKSLQDENKGDIFETDFELPALGDESGSEVVAVDDDSETSGFDVDVQDLDSPDDESTSQVVVVDDEVEPLVDDEDALGDVELEEGASASKALRGVRRRGVEEDVPAQVVVQTPPRWGALPAIVLMPCVLLLFLGGLMSFEAVRGMWGYHQPAPPANGLVRGVADTLGMKVAD